MPIKILFKALFLLLFTLTSSTAYALEKPMSHSLFDRFLKKYVDEKGNVDYAAVKKDPALLDQYLKKMKKHKLKKYAEWPREETIALWINLYHAGLIRKILEFYPIKNVHEIPGFWEMDSVYFGKSSYSLNRIRDLQLMKSFKDEKIHFALSLAAKGGPRLSRDAYTGPSLEGQLYRAVKQFLNDSELKPIHIDKRKVLLSKIFEWHAVDFKLQFATFENDLNISNQDYAVLSFIAHYLNDESVASFLEEGNYKISYQKFNWNLNDALNPSPAGTSSPEI